MYHTLSGSRPATALHLFTTFVAVVRSDAAFFVALFGGILIRVNNDLHLRVGAESQSAIRRGLAIPDAPPIYRSSQSPPPRR